MLCVYIWNLNTVRKVNAGTFNCGGKCISMVPSRALKCSQCTCMHHMHLCFSQDVLVVRDPARLDWIGGSKVEGLKVWDKLKNLTVTIFCFYHSLSTSCKLVIGFTNFDNLAFLVLRALPDGTTYPNVILAASMWPSNVRPQLCTFPPVRLL